jgi:hypothetical protein
MRLKDQDFNIGKRGEGEIGGEKWSSEEVDERERRKENLPRIKMARKKIGRRKERGRYVVRRASTLKRDGLERGTQRSRNSADGDFSDWSLGSGSGNGREWVTEIGPEEHLPVSVQERVTGSGSERVSGNDPDPPSSKESSLHVKRAKIRDSA